MAERTVGGLLVLVPAAAFFVVAASSVIFTLLSGSPISQLSPWTIVEMIRAGGFEGPRGRQLLVSLALPSGLAIILALHVALQRPDTAYGDARYATPREIREAGLLAEDGVLLGGIVGGRYLRWNGEGHMLSVMPTRSGKTVGTVIPNLLSWRGSVVAFDPKGELYRRTSGFRAKGQPVYCWSPGSEDGYSHGHDFLRYVREGPLHRIKDVRQLCRLMVPDLPGENPMWNGGARNLLYGLVGYVLETEDVPGTMGEVARTFFCGQDLGAVCRHLTGGAAATDGHEPWWAEALLKFANIDSAKQRAGIAEALTPVLEVFRDAVTDAATSRSDFDLCELRREPASVYVSVNMTELPAYQNLLSLFFQQLISVLGRQEPGAEEPHEVLVLIDEFGEFYMPLIVKALAYLGSYKVRVALIVQGLSQLAEKYGPEGMGSVLQNTGSAQVFAAANDERTARYLSDRIGHQTIQTKTRSRGSSGGRASAGRSFGWTGQPLLRPDQVGRLPRDEVVVLTEGRFPVKAKKVRWFEDKEMKRRAAFPPAPVPPLELMRHRRRHFDIGEEGRDAAPGGWPGGESMAAAAARAPVHVDEEELALAAAAEGAGHGHGTAGYVAEMEDVAAELGSARGEPAADDGDDPWLGAALEEMGALFKKEDRAEGGEPGDEAGVSDIDVAGGPATKGEAA